MNFIVLTYQTFNFDIDFTNVKFGFEFPYIELPSGVLNHGWSYDGGIGGTINAPIQ